MKSVQWFYVIAVFFSVAWVPARAQVTTLQCNGTAYYPQAATGSRIPPASSVGFSGTFVIDTAKGVFSGDLLSSTAIAGFPMHEVEITEVKASSVGGKKTFMASSGAFHALHVWVDRNTGKVVLFEFPEGGRSAFTGFSLNADCKVARPLF